MSDRIKAEEARKITENSDFYVFQWILKYIDDEIRDMALVGNQVYISDKDFTKIKNVGEYDLPKWKDKIISHYIEMGFKASWVNLYHMYLEDTILIEW